MSVVILLGASGLVGSIVLRQLILTECVDRIVAPTRSPLRPDPKLINPVLADFLNLASMDIWTSVDAVICTLGTTRKIAGSDEEFKRIDRDMPVALAQKARQMEIPAFGYVSSIGANPKSPFLYTRTKGEVEEALFGLGFKSLTIVRPSLISGNRSKRRMFEGVATGVLHLLSPLLPLSVRPNRADDIATILVDRALSPRIGETVIRSKDLAVENSPLQRD